jgi:hypothetical protein
MNCVPYTIQYGTAVPALPEVILDGLAQPFRQVALEVIGQFTPDVFTLDGHLCGPSLAPCGANAPVLSIDRSCDSEPTVKLRTGKPPAPIIAATNAALRHQTIGTHVHPNCRAGTQAPPSDREREKGESTVVEEGRVDTLPEALPVGGGGRNEHTSNHSRSNIEKPRSPRL